MQCVRNTVNDQCKDLNVLIINKLLYFCQLQEKLNELIAKFPINLEEINKSISNRNPKVVQLDDIEENDENPSVKLKNSIWNSVSKNSTKETTKTTK